MLLPILGILLLIPAALAAQSLASHGPSQTFDPLLVSSCVAFAIWSLTGKVASFPFHTSPDF